MRKKSGKPSPNGLADAVRSLTEVQTKLDQSQLSLTQSQAALNQAMATMTTNQTAFVERMSAFAERMAAADARFAAVQEENARRFARIEALLLEHNRLLEALPEAVREKIRFRGAGHE
jgi:peptidoglycan hydrolase CwlO-like protein